MRLRLRVHRGLVPGLVGPGVVVVVHGVGGEGGEGCGEGGEGRWVGGRGVVQLDWGRRLCPSLPLHRRVLFQAFATVVAGFIEHVLEVLDVLDCVAEDGDLGQLLDGAGAGDVAFEDVEPVVDGLDPVALPGVAPGHLDVLGRGDGVAVDRVDGHQLGAGLHHADLVRINNQQDACLELQ